MRNPRRELKQEKVAKMEGRIKLKARILVEIEEGIKHGIDCED